MAEGRRRVPRDAHGMGLQRRPTGGIEDVGELHDASCANRNPCPSHRKSRSGARETQDGRAKGEGATRGGLSLIAVARRRAAGRGLGSVKPYGWRMRANDYDGKDDPVPVVLPKRERQRARREIRRKMDAAPESGED